MSITRAIASIILMSFFFGTIAWVLITKPVFASPSTPVGVLMLALFFGLWSEFLVRRYSTVEVWETDDTIQALLKSVRFLAMVLMLVSLYLIERKFSGCVADGIVLLVLGMAWGALTMQRWHLYKISNGNCPSHEI